MASDHLSTVLNALADPTRRGMLARLANGEATVTELAEPYDMSMAAISKHLKVLERAGLIEQGRDSYSDDLLASDDGSGAEVVPAGGRP